MYRDVQAVEVRRADLDADDIEAVYRARFESESSRMFSDVTVPSLGQHARWMKGEVESGRSVIYIGMLDGRSIGYARFAHGPSSRDMVAALETYPDLWFASLAVEVSYRGRGCGSAMFQQAELAFLGSQVTRPITLMTWARADNLASWRLFESAGWRRTEINGFREVVMRTVN